jgi:hypothetical protein
VAILTTSEPDEALPPRRRGTPRAAKPQAKQAVKATKKASQTAGTVLSAPPRRRQVGGSITIAARLAKLAKTGTARTAATARVARHGATEDVPQAPSVPSVPAGTAVIDPGIIPAKQSPSKANVTPAVAVEGDLMTVQVRLPQLPPGSHAPIESIREMFVWWLTQAAIDAANVIPKAVEYSSEDLFILGRTMVETMGLPLDKYSRGDLEELGIFFYVTGKHSRWSGAIREGRRVSNDTVDDEIIYRFMIRRIRAVGRWPGVKLH